MSEKNCKELAKQKDIDGFLVGGASLKPACKPFSQSYCGSALLTTLNQSLISSTPFSRRERLEDRIEFSSWTQKRIGTAYPTRANGLASLHVVNSANSQSFGHMMA